jgi:thiol-disulfide isomerase/thioredoxin
MMWEKVLSLLVLLSSGVSGGWLWAAEPPADRIVVMYFHRTQRCPTCMRMEAYARQALQEAFPEQLQAGQIAFYSIDFQDPQNARLTKAYQVSAPSLIVVRVVNHKGVEFKNLQEIWLKVRDQKEYFQYVQKEVGGYLPKSTPPTATQ